jgi:hypothetical protein
MIERLRSNDTTIARIRLMSSSADPAAVQLRLASLLSGAQLQPVLPGPAAIVYIRKLRDPSPGRLKLDSGCGLSAAWERALSESISQLAGSAARPALGQVPANAESVIFLDPSELLACLASDLIDGSAISRWWWRSLFRASDVTSAVAREWLTSIEYVPAAFVKLAQKGNAIEFAGSLPHSVVDRLLDEITRNFALTDLRSFLSLSKIERHAPAIGLSYQSKSSRSKLAEPLSSRELTEVRTRLAPEAFAQGLTPDARLLLVLALLLERTPALLRERTFARRLMASLLATDITEGIDVPTQIEPMERSQGGGLRPTKTIYLNRGEHIRRVAVRRLPAAWGQRIVPMQRVALTIELSKTGRALKSKSKASAKPFAPPWRIYLKSYAENQTRGARNQLHRRWEFRWWLQNILGPAKCKRPRHSARRRKLGRSRCKRARSRLRPWSINRNFRPL